MLKGRAAKEPLCSRVVRDRATAGRGFRGFAVFAHLIVTQERDSRLGRGRARLSTDLRRQREDYAPPASQSALAHGNLRGLENMFRAPGSERLYRGYECVILASMFLVRACRRACFMSSVFVLFVAFLASLVRQVEVT